MSDDSSSPSSSEIDTSGWVFSSNSTDDDTTPFNSPRLSSLSRESHPEPELGTRSDLGRQPSGEMSFLVWYAHLRGFVPSEGVLWCAACVSTRPRKVGQAS